MELKSRNTISMLNWLIRSNQPSNRLFCSNNSIFYYHETHFTSKLTWNIIKIHFQFPPIQYFYTFKLADFYFHFYSFTTHFFSNSAYSHLIFHGPWRWCLRSSKWNVDDFEKLTNLFLRKIRCSIVCRGCWLFSWQEVIKKMRTENFFRFLARNI